MAVCSVERGLPNLCDTTLEDISVEKINALFERFEFPNIYAIEEQEMRSNDEFDIMNFIENILRRLPTTNEIDKKLSDDFLSDKEFSNKVILLIELLKIRSDLRFADEMDEALKDIEKAKCIAKKIDKDLEDCYIKIENLFIQTLYKNIA